MERKRILYIDHKNAHRRSLAQRLRLLGYAVNTAAASEAGLRLFNQKKFDIVLCELKMPERDGLGTLKIIRKKDPDTPFVLLSDAGTAIQAVNAVRLGANCFVLMPKDDREIAVLIDQTIEKAKLEKVCRESQSSLKLVSENVPDIIYSLSAKGEFISLSPSVKAMMGYSTSDLLGVSIFQVIHPDDRERVKRTFLKSVETADSKVKTSQFRMTTKAGKIKHFEIRSKMVVKNGRVIRNDGIAREVTHRIHLEDRLKKYHEDIAEANLSLLRVQDKLREKNAEMEKLLEKLSLSKEELQTIIDASPDVMLLVGLDGIIKTANKRVTEYFGLVLEKVVSSTFDEFMTGIKNQFEDFNKFYKQIEHLKREPGSSRPMSISEFFGKGVRIIGQKSCLLVPSNRRVYDKKHKEIGLLWIFSDIAHLKQAEEQVNTIIDSSPIPMIISRFTDGKILWANSKLADLVGLTQEELIGQNTPDFYYLPKDRETVLQRLRQDGYLRNFETRIKKADGSIIWMIFSLVITQMRDEDVIIGWLYDISERKRTEEALTKERNFVSAVLKTESALVVVLDTKGRIVRFNLACEQVSGYTLDEVRMKHIWDIFLIPEEVDLVKAAFKGLKSSRNSSKSENFWVTKKGDRRLIDWSNSVLLDDEGSVEYIIGTGIDITEHRKAEEAILNRLRYEQGLAACSKALMKESESKDALLEALFHLNEASNTSSVYILQNYEDAQLGLCARLTHQVCQKCMDGSPKPTGLKHFVYSQGFERWRKALSKGKPIMGTVKTLPKSESSILELLGTLSILALPLWVQGEWYGLIGFEDDKKLRDWSGDDIRLLQTAADIVDDYIERKKIEEILRVSEERFRGLVENANDLIFSLNAKGDFSYLSPKLTDLLGYEISNLIGEPFSKLMHPEDAKKSVELFRQRLKDGKKETGFEFRLRHKDGSIRWFISNSSVIFDEKGEVIEIVGVAHDITAMKKILDDLAQANTTLRETQAQLVQSEKMAALGSLVAGIAHEINTPLGAVNSMYDTVFRTLEKLKATLESRHPEDHEQISWLKSTYETLDDSAKVIRLGTNRVTNIVQRLRSFARLDEAEIKTVDIHEGLEDTLTLIHHELKQNITVKKKYGKIPPISCFPSQLNQVFLNLLVNSKQAVKGKGIIEITTGTKDDKVFIAFKDNGSGISKESLSKIFDPGFTTKGRGVGTGLGLSISYQIIQQHRGEIKVDTAPGKGTTFTVILPMDLERILEESKDQP